MSVCVVVVGWHWQHHQIGNKVGDTQIRQFDSYLFKTEEMDEGFSENTFCHCLNFSKLKRPLVHHNFLNLELGNKNK